MYISFSRKCEINSSKQSSFESVIPSCALDISFYGTVLVRKLQPLPLHPLLSDMLCSAISEIPFSWHAVKSTVSTKLFLACKKLYFQNHNIYQINKKWNGDWFRITINLLLHLLRYERFLVCVWSSNTIEICSWYTLSKYVPAKAYFCWLRTATKHKNITQ